MILRSMLALFPPLLIGWTLVLAIWPGPRRAFWLLKIILGAGIGMGIDSILFFCWSLLFSPQHKGFLGLELILLLSLVYFLLRPQPGKPFELPHLRLVRPRLSWVSWILLAIFAVSLLAAAMAFIFLTLSNPHGTFDAYSIWNLRSRFIYAGGMEWRTAFSPLLAWKAHADYPLLLPANVARLWIVIGEESQRAPQLLAGLFTFLLVGLLFSTISNKRSLGQASLAGIVLTATPWLITIGINQTADLPIAFFILAACAMWLNAISLNEPRIGVLAGLAAGLSAWTKNEGLALLIAMFVTLPILWLGLRGPFCKRLIASFTLGIAIPIGVLILFKLTLSPPGDLFTNQGLIDIVQKILTPERYWVVIRAAGKMGISMGGWVIPILILLLTYVIIVFRAPPSNETPAWKYIVVSLVLTLLAYLLTYVITPHPQTWHLNYSLDRVLFQIYPAFLLVVFGLTRNPEDLMTNH